MTEILSLASTDTGSLSPCMGEGQGEGVFGGSIIVMTLTPTLSRFAGGEKQSATRGELHATNHDCRQPAQTYLAGSSQ